MTTIENNDRVRPNNLHKFTIVHECVTDATPVHSIRCVRMHEWNPRCDAAIYLHELCSITN